MPGRTLATALAEEWQRAGGQKGGEMSFADAPLTRIAGTGQDRIAPDPEPTVDALARYGESDLLCYRATGPDALVRLQAEHWQPWLDWAALELDAPLRVGSGVVHLPQPAGSLHALRRAVAAQDPFVLAGLGVLVPALGSLVLALALIAGRLDAAAAHAASIVDELHQQELWGRGRRSLGAPAARRRGRCARRPVRRTGPRGMNAKRLVIHGRVQGVGYRAWLTAAANRLGVSGWVRNRQDGSVEALLAGETDAIEELARACRRGPRLAMVSEIHEHPAEAPAEPGFRERGDA